MQLALEYPISVTLQLPERKRVQKSYTSLQPAPDRVGFAKSDDWSSSESKAQCLPAVAPTTISSAKMNRTTLCWQRCRPRLWNCIVRRHSDQVGLEVPRGQSLRQPPTRGSITWKLPGMCSIHADPRQACGCRVFFHVVFVNLSTFDSTDRASPP